MCRWKRYWCEELLCSEESSPAELLSECLKAKDAKTTCAVNAATSTIVEEVMEKKCAKCSKALRRETDKAKK